MRRLSSNTPIMVALLAALVLAAVPVTASAGQSVPVPATPAATGTEQFTPLLWSVHRAPQWFPGSDGQIHLAYELVLTNTFPVDITVTSIEVADPGTGEPIARFENEGLGAVMTLLASPRVPEVTIPPSTIGVAWLDIVLPDRDALPESITHTITVAVPPGLPVPATITATDAPVAVDQREPIVLGAPLAGPQWAAVGSCCDGPHRRAFQPINGDLHLSQRYAIDFNLLDDENRLEFGDRTRNESTPGYGQPVLAVADATVVAAVDGIPDQIPGGALTGVTLETAEGNHIVLDLGDGRYAFYAHLRTGTVAVRTGDVVRQGQVIGELGNSGSSSGAHLHFHVMDGPSSLASNGMPYVFADYALTGQLPPLDEIGPLFEQQLSIPIGPIAGGSNQTDTLPLGGNVMTFPAPQAAGSR